MSPPDTDALTRNGPPARGGDTPLLHVNRLSHSYGGFPVLAEVSFTVYPRECVALIGPNGAGKTTLLLRLCGVLPGMPGQVGVGGLDPADPQQRRKLPAVVGMVFQNPDDQLFCPSVLEDVAFGPLNLGVPPEEAWQRALQAMEAVGLPTSWGDRPPHQLSGGDKRRAALAGVLAMHPQLLLLDEPTAFLDPRGRRELIHLLKRISCAQLIATHDLQLVAAIASRVILLDGGRLIADGPPEDILTDGQLLEQHGLEPPGPPYLASTCMSQASPSQGLQSDAPGQPSSR